MGQKKPDVTFFDRHHVDVARDMIGTHLPWEGVGGMVVETEAYAAVDGKAVNKSGTRLRQT